MDIKKFKQLKGNGYLVVDVRKPAEFAEGFIPCSLNLPPEAIHNDWAEWFLLEDRAFVLVGNEGQEQWATEELKNRGFKECYGFFVNGYQKWYEEGLDPDMVIRVFPEELKLDVKHDKDARIIDIRPGAEFEKVHVKKATNIPLKTLFSQWQDLSEDKPHFVYGDNDASSMVVVSYLKMQDRHNFYQVAGTIEDFEEEGVPLEKASTKK